MDSGVQWLKRKAKSATKYYKMTLTQSMPWPNKPTGYLVKKRSSKMA
jgi:hypothetical protein